MIRNWFFHNSFMNEKKNAQNVWSKDLVYKKPFGYRVVHHGCSLMSCPSTLRFSDKISIKQLCSRTLLTCNYKTVIFSYVLWF